jgi:predicted RecA/RadA family phage recombinase
MATNYEQDGKKMYLETAASAESGDPMVLGDFLPVVLLKDADADDSNKAVVQTEGVFNLSVQAVDDDGNSAVSKYDALYYTSGDDPVLSKKSSGEFYGVALEAITSGQTDTIKVMLRAKAGLGSVTEAILAASVQDRIAQLSVSATDNGDGTATLTIQAQDAGGNSLADNVFVRTWVGGADDFGVDAITGVTASTGTVVHSHTANGDVDVVTDATGLAELALDNGGAGSIYAWCELGGRIYASGEIAITSA